VICNFAQPRQLRAAELRGLLGEFAVRIDLHAYTQEEFAHSLLTT
jgi:hypothetical protein